MSKHQKILILTVIVGLLMPAVNVMGQDSLLINYQGYLTDSDGLPISDALPITFTIYDNSGVSHWSETHPSVDVVDGKFNVILGSQARLENTVFSEAELYLGINIGEERDEILPRTLLTSVPGAAAATKMRGDMVSEPGIIRLYPPDPCVPPEPCLPSIEMITDNSDLGNSVNLYYPGGDSDDGIVQVGVNAVDGGFIELHAVQPLTVTRVMMGGSTADTGFVRLFGGPDGFEYKLLELNSHTNTGGTIKFLDPENIDGRELLTINCSPPAERGEYGWSIVGFNPQPEPPGIPALELGMDFDDGTPENYFRLNNPLTEHLGDPLIEMTADLTSGAQFKIFDLAPSGDSRDLLTMGNTPTEGIGIYGFNPQPEPPGMVAFEIETQSSSRGPGGGRIAIYDTDDHSAELTGSTIQMEYLNPLDESETLVKLSTSLEEQGIVIVNTKPGAGAVNDSVSVQLGVDAQSRGIIIIKDKPGDETTAGSSVNIGAGLDEEGIVIVNTKPAGAGSDSMAVSMETSSTQAELTLFKGASVDEADIALRVNSDGARVGIGTNSPSEELYVVGDITATGAITELSSLKYKTSINSIDNALHLVGGLRGVRFNWRTNGYPKLQFTDDRQIGMIAEEVETILPELVHADADGEKSVNYSKLTAVLVEAVKELKADNEELRDRIEQLEEQLR